MTVKEIQSIARDRGLKTGKLRKHELVRAIQSDEGNFSCYATAARDACAQDACLWRADCLKQTITA